MGANRISFDKYNLELHNKNCENFECCIPQAGLGFKPTGKSHPKKNYLEICPPNIKPPEKKIKISVPNKKPPRNQSSDNIHPEKKTPGKYAPGKKPSSM